MRILDVIAPGSTISPCHPTTNCNKGGSSLPGYYITSEVKIVKVLGSDCSGNAETGHGFWTH